MGLRGKGFEFQGFGWNAHRNSVKFYFSHKRQRILERAVVVSLDRRWGLDGPNRER